MTRYLSIIMLLLILAGPVVASADDSNGHDGSSVNDNKVLLLNGTLAATILAWGYTSWDYGEKTPHTQSEGWFGHDTTEGGVDKLGHLYTGYALTHGVATLCRSWGYAREKAALHGAGTSLMVTGLMEVGDSFSTYGFSYEDMIANMLGAVAGYYLYRYPEVQKKIDLRWEYRPEFHDLKGDFTTDYEHSKYLLAIKAEGFSSVRNDWLKALELHVGYYARGYDDFDGIGPDERNRYLYVGIGLNVTRLIRPFSRTRLFNYLQMPYTYVEGHHKLD